LLEEHSLLTLVHDVLLIRQRVFHEDVVQEMLQLLNHLEQCLCSPEAESFGKEVLLPPLRELLLDEQVGRLRGVSQQVLNSLQQCATNSDECCRLICADTPLLQQVLNHLQAHQEDRTTTLCFGVLGAVLSGDVGPHIVQELVKMDLDQVLFQALTSMKSEEDKRFCLKYFLWILSNMALEVDDK